MDIGYRRAMPPIANFSRRWAWALIAGMAAVAQVQAQPPRPITDSLAERVQACTACHGEQGRAGPDGYYPRLAGKPAGYLHNQLRHFAQGRRHYGPMVRLTEPLTDAYLGEIAGYFAGLTLPYPPPSAERLSAEQRQRAERWVRQGDAARGVPACMACHGERLTGVLPHVPGLLGLPRDYINAQLGAWQTGQRRAHTPDCMAEVVRRLPSEDLAAVAAWLAATPVPPNSTPAAGVAKPITAPEWRCGSAPELAGVRP